MKNLKCYACLVLIFVFSQTASLAQPYVDVVNLRSQKYGFSEKETLELSGSIFLPLELKNENYFLIGTSFSRLTFQDSFQDLGSFDVQIGGIRKLNDNWQVMFLLIPKISSDFTPVSRDDYQFGGVVLTTKNVREDLKYKFGIYANQQFFGLMIIPLLGIDWKASEKLNVFGVLPGSMNMEYGLMKKTFLGLSFKSITTSYRLNPQFDRAYVREGDTIWGHQQWKIYGYFNIFKSVIMELGAGHTAFRIFDIYRFRTKEKIDSYSGYGDEFFISIGTAFRIRT